MFSVTPQGALNVKNGPGQVEYQGELADFVLQLEIISEGKELNSGIFFRNIPGSFQQGYECQVNNGFKNGDRTQPKDCGTGGFYRRQNARKVVPNDFEWFRETLVVSGPHMAAWVNGYQVSDWTDTRSPSENPREGLRLKAGTLVDPGARSDDEPVVPALAGGAAPAAIASRCTHFFDSSQSRHYADNASRSGKAKLHFFTSRADRQNSKGADYDSA